MTEQNVTIYTQHADPLVESVSEVKRQVAAMHKLMTDVMQPNIHYGVIPGTGDKPTLLKPGAEKIALLLGLAASFKHTMMRDGAHLEVISECTLTRRATGQIVTSASGLCSTRETKYAFRQTTRKCPKCGKAAIIKGNAEYGGGWLCYAKKDGCGAKFSDKDPAIVNQSGEREDNPNIADTTNTVLKMADKRAFVAAILIGTAASDIYTQDVEDLVDGASEPTPRPTAAQRSQADAKGLPSAAFEGHVQDFEEAAERGEGRSWWAGNAAVRAQCNEEQLRRLVARANEFRQAAATKQAGGGASAGEGTVPAGSEGAPPSLPAEEGPGQSALDLEMETAFNLGGGGAPLELGPPPAFPRLPDSVLPFADAKKGHPIKAIVKELRDVWPSLGKDPRAVVAKMQQRGAAWAGMQPTPESLSALGDLTGVCQVVLEDAGYPSEL